MPAPTAKCNGRDLTVAALAEAKHLPANFLRELGLCDLPGGGVAIPYYGPTGEEIAVKRRTALKAKEGSYWPKRVPLTAYGQWRLDTAAKASFLPIVEGESDCWAFWHHGLPALGIPGANAAKTLEKGHVAAVPTVYVHREPDDAGARFLAGVRARLSTLDYRGAVYELTMPPGVKDPSDLHVRDPDQFKAALAARIEAAGLIELTPPAGPAPGNRVADRAVTDAAEEEVPARLATTCLLAVRPESVRWLVPGYLPLGKLVLIAGDGGHGKSTLTLDLAACITTGRPCFGQQYDARPRATCCSSRAKTTSGTRWSRASCRPAPTSPGCFGWTASPARTASCSRSPWRTSRRRRGSCGSGPGSDWSSSTPPAPTSARPG
jgi:hypothetical protein